MPLYVPKPGLIVPNPFARFAPVPESGVVLPPRDELPPYWERRLQDGDLVLADQPNNLAPEIEA